MKVTRNRLQSRPDLAYSRRWQIPDCQIAGAADQYEKACRLLFAQPPGSGVALPLINSAAVAIELYLKSLSAERIYIADEMMPEVSVVGAYASVGHPLIPLFEAISDEEVRVKLIEAYDAKLRINSEGDFVSALKKLDGAFSKSRYPYEPNVNVSEIERQSLVGMVRFLRDFVHALPPVSDGTKQPRKSGSP